MVHEVAVLQTQLDAVLCLRLLMECFPVLFSCTWFAFALFSLSRYDCPLSEDTGCVLTFWSMQLSGAPRHR